jgi:hypothetical protein
MSFTVRANFGNLIAVGILAAALAGCENAGQTVAAGVGGSNPNVYALSSAVTFANMPPATGVASFDISFVDPSVHQFYLADRLTNGVDVIDTQTLQYLRTAGAGLFAGFKPAGPGGPATNAGPNGLVPVGNGIVFAGDGDSTLKVVNVNTGALLATVPAVNPYTGPPLPAACGGTGIPTTGTANQRLDEMAYDPTDGVVLAINDAACPPFGTFYSATAPYAAVGSVAFTTANGGAEQPTWDPTQNLFIMALPSTIANPGGEIDLIDPHSHAIVKTLPETNCNANGTALGKGETLFLACSGTAQIVTINAATGATINSIAGLGGCDEAWYNPTADRFYAGCSNNTAGPVLVVASGSGALIQSIATSTGAHSIAADPATDHIFLPTQKLGIQIYTH